MATKDMVPDIRPRAGHDLLVGIDGVLPRLSAPTESAMLAESLMTALVRTAACGDICRVRQQADAIRIAAAHLRAGEPEKADPVLRRARAGLLPG